MCSNVTDEVSFLFSFLGSCAPRNFYFAALSSFHLCES
jgi:hypothetical protein